MPTARLDLLADSSGFELANKRLEEAAASSRAAEAAAKRLADAVDAAAARRVTAEGRATDAAERASARQAKAAEESATRRAAAEQRAAEVARQRAAEREAATAKQVLDERKAQDARLMEVRKSLMTERELIRQGEAERRVIILSNTTITERERSALIRASTQKMNAELAASSRASVFSSIPGGAAMGGFLGAAGALAIGSSIIGITREFDKLNAALITATGSELEAAKAFGVLQQFAIDTPYSLRQVVDAFVQLRQVGLDPSERALKAYGDMAAARGKDLDQLILAVTDATMGIMLPLKRFGVVAEQETDKVVFTFRGVKTEVEKNAFAIEEYLMKLAENNFAGAMAERMKTLDGALSNLGDAWDKFALSVSQSGLEATLTEIVRLMESALDSISKYIKENKEGIEVVSAGLSSLSLFKQAGSSSFGLLPGLLSGGLPTGGSPAAASVGREERAAEEEQVKDHVDRLAKYREDAKKVETEQNVAALKELMKHLLSKEEKMEESYKRQLLIIQKGTEGNAEMEQQLTLKLNERFAEKLEALAKKNRKHESAAHREFRKMVEDVTPEIQKIEEHYQKRQRIIERFTRFASERRAELSKYNSDLWVKEMVEFEQKHGQKLEELRKSLRTEEETIAESYRRRRQIVLDNSGGAEQEALMKKLEEDRQKALNDLAKKRYLGSNRSFDVGQTRDEGLYKEYDAKRVDVLLSDRTSDEKESQLKALRVSYEAQLKAYGDSKREAAAREREAALQDFMTEEEQIAASYEKRQKMLDEALQKRHISEEEHAQSLERLEAETSRRRMELNEKYATQALGHAESLFGGLAGVIKNFGGEQSKAYRVLFAASQAFAAAQTAVSIAAGVANAQTLPWPQNLIEGIRVAALGAKLASQISGAAYAGAYDEGGRIPAGKVGLVGEYGPEFVTGPADVTSRRATAQAVRDMSSSGQQPISVRIVNAPDATAAAQYAHSSAMERVILNVVSTNAETIRQVVAR